MSYGLRIIFSEPSVGKIMKIMIGRTDVFLQGPMVSGHAMNITITHPNTLNSKPLRSYRIENCENHSGKSANMKTPQFRISNRRFHIPTTKITLNVMSQISHGRDHVERYVPTYQESPKYFLSSQNYLYEKFPGSCFALSHVHKGSICMDFHNYKYLLLRSSLVFYILTKTGECWIY